MIRATIDLEFMPEEKHEQELLGSWLNGAISDYCRHNRPIAGNIQQTKGMWSILVTASDDDDDYRDFRQWTENGQRSPKTDTNDSRRIANLIPIQKLDPPDEH
ncbi:MAG: hypothetical protein VKL39_00925 [Leptolyngbyaceae bacterium]|nr:hypothetical protein [Leptolyngbyaceae bacterium]